ncbi:DUF4294 domain-containing protein [Alloprevotella sp. OH1205_COT-284]|nr:DUF4294 domain-containing protein [Alloprevotella sp. OH1205_COT-284]
MTLPPTRLLSLLLACLPLALSAQSAQSEIDDLPSEKKGETPPAVALSVQVGKAAYKGDSIPHVIMPTLHKYPPMEFKNEKERQRYNRLVANIKKLLPLAKMVKITIIETYEYLETLPSKEARDAHLDAMERGLKREYMPVVSRMSRSQGRLLIKLIDRECNQTGYQIAKAFIGSLKANFYQGVGFIFGLSLNKHYDPEGDDRFTERVVRMVESGQL